MCVIERKTRRRSQIIVTVSSLMRLDLLQKTMKKRAAGGDQPRTEACVDEDKSQSNGDIFNSGVIST